MQIFGFEEFFELSNSTALNFMHYGVLFMQVILFLHISYFVARTIKTLQLKVTSPLILKQYLFLMCCVLLIKLGGIIFLQSTVNKIEEL